MKPISGGRQLGWLNLTAPNATRISVQFLENHDNAKAELAAVKKTDPKFQGLVIGSTLIFTTRDGGDATIPKTDTTALSTYLK